jgi:hypothetical protein
VIGYPGMEEIKEIRDDVKKLRKGEIIKTEMVKIIMRHDEYLCLTVIFVIFSTFVIDLYRPLLGVNIIALILGLGAYLIPIVTSLSKHREKIDQIREELRNLP